MRQRGDGSGFALEPRQAVRIVGERLGQNFQGNVTAKACVARAIHLAHSAFAKLGDDP